MQDKFRFPGSLHSCLPSELYKPSQYECIQNEVLNRKVRGSKHGLPSALQNLIEMSSFSTVFPFRLWKERVRQESIPNAVDGVGEPCFPWACPSQVSMHVVPTLDSCNDAFLFLFFYPCTRLQPFPAEKKISKETKTFPIKQTTIYTMLHEIHLLSCLQISRT